MGKTWGHILCAISGGPQGLPFMDAVCVCLHVCLCVPLQVTVCELQRHPTLPLVRQLAARRFDVHQRPSPALSVARVARQPASVTERHLAFLRQVVGIGITGGGGGGGRQRQQQVEHNTVQHVAAPASSAVLTYDLSSGTPEQVTVLIGSLIGLQLFIPSEI